MARRHLLTQALPGWVRISSAQFVNIVLAAESGSFTLTGKDVEFLLNTGGLNAATGTYVITGQAVAFLRGLVMPASVGAFALTGQAAVVGRHFSMSADTDSFALSGRDAAFVRALNLIAETGSYALTGTSSGLVVALAIAAQSGSFALTGQDAAFVSATGYTVAANAASFLAAGQDAGLIRGLTLSGGAGAFALNGLDTDLLRVESLAAAAGAFALTGQDAALIKPIISTFKTSINSNVGATSFTHAHNGGVRTGKWAVAVAARRNSAGTNTDPSTVTLAGASLTKLVGNTNSRTNVSIWISAADVTTDGTDGVVATWASDAQAGVFSSLYAIDNLQSSTAVATATSSTSPSALSVNVSAGGCVLGVGVNYANSTFTWTNITENTDVLVTGSLRASSAVADFASAATPKSVTATHSSTEATACSVSLR
jgi:hypothetical protein